MRHALRHLVLDANRLTRGARKRCGPAAVEPLAGYDDFEFDSDTRGVVRLARAVAAGVGVRHRWGAGGRRGGAPVDGLGLRRLELPRNQLFTRVFADAPVARERPERDALRARRRRGLRGGVACRRWAGNRWAEYRRLCTKDDETAQNNPSSHAFVQHLSLYVFEF